MERSSSLREAKSSSSTVASSATGALVPQQRQGSRFSLSSGSSTPTAGGRRGGGAGGMSEWRARRRRAFLRRKLRRTLFVVLFTRFVHREMRDQQWGMHVERYDNILLESRSAARLPPSSYFAAMSGCSLPPGSLIKNYPAEIRQQVETFAKNVIVRLLTPQAKRYALRRHLRILRELSITQDTITKFKAPAVLKSSTLFELWSDSQLMELQDASFFRVYKADQWISCPGLGAAFNGTVIVSGTVAEIQMGGDVVAENISTGHIFGETRLLTASYETTGLWSRTPTVTFEIDWRVIQQRLGTLSLTQQVANKKYISLQRQEVIQHHCPLTIEMLKETDVFSSWDDGDLVHVIPSFKAKVAFDGEELVSDSPAGPSEMVLLARGTAQLIAGTSGFLEGSVLTRSHFPFPNSLSPHPTESNRLIKLLGKGDVFGELSVLSEERPLASLVAEGTVDYWALPRTTFLQHVKRPAQRRALEKSTVQVKQRFLEITKDPVAMQDRLISISFLFKLLFHVHQIGKGPSPVDVLMPLFSAKTYSIGERITTANEPLTHLIFIQCGRVIEPSVDKNQPYSAPCLIGLSLLGKEKCGSTLIAARHCDCWVVPRRQFFHAVKSYPEWRHALLNYFRALHRQRVSEAAANKSTPGGGSDAAGSGGGGVNVSLIELSPQRRYAVAPPQFALTGTLRRKSRSAVEYEPTGPSGDDAAAVALAAESVATAHRRRGTLFLGRQPAGSLLLSAQGEGLAPDSVLGTGLSLREGGRSNSIAFALQNTERENASLVVPPHLPPEEHHFHTDDRIEVRRAARKKKELQEKQAAREEEKREQQKRRRCAPPPPDRVSHSKFEGLQRIKPSPREVYAILQKLPSELSEGVEKHIETYVRTASPTATRALAAGHMSLGRMTHPQPEAKGLGEFVEVSKERGGRGLTLNPSAPVSPPPEGKVHQLLVARQRQAEGHHRPTPPGSTGSTTPSPLARRKNKRHTAVVLADAPEDHLSGVVEKAVMQQILAQHKERVATARESARSTCTVNSEIQRNPFSNFGSRRGVGVPKMTPLGELYTEDLSTAQVHIFDPKKHDLVVPPSFVSVHGRLD